MRNWWYVCWHNSVTGCRPCSLRLLACSPRVDITEDSWKNGARHGCIGLVYREQELMASWLVRHAGGDDSQWRDALTYREILEEVRRLPHQEQLALLRYLEEN